MVHFSLSALASILALTPVINAVAVPVEPFSFEKWIDGKISNPNGTHLTADEAYEAYMATRLDVDAGSLSKRATCNVHDKVAPAADAARAIDYLASIGNQDCKVKVTQRFSTWGNAEISGNGRGGATVPWVSKCNDIARAAGKVMDTCWRADGTVQGSEYAWGNGNIAVHVQRKGTTTVMD
ncbi:hypothetical protein QBC38DRAFT_420503 [Podospora fimiseda]|uniref:Ecp2 effector protein domain-containing protein n=1 Tax=Podospora fimiseda TaxID=252190 RepID=A0AAN7BLH9_9PEZI|nr:hypothetical protein QBC38DRAFT_420503 [Podospora fimiseda]